MNISTKLLKAAAGQAGGATLDVDDCFSCFLYTGNGSSSSATQTITNGIDLTEGGLIWTKYRSGGSISTSSHALIDTERGGNKELSSDLIGAEQFTGATQYFSFNNNGYTINSYYLANAYTNLNNADFVSWTFRKAPKFFDIVTYTGNNGTQTINHNLGSVPGMIIVKRLNDAGHWGVKHRSIPATKGMFLNQTAATYTNSTYWGDTEPTSTQFTVSLTNSVDSAPYVAYLFAHNNNDGEFGPSGDQDIIKCGSYTGDGGAGTTEVNLGFEPQWILVKASSAADSWYIIDNMRGWGTHNNRANDAYLYANATNAEATGGVLDITSTGFRTTLYSNANVNGREYIYMAIRRGPLAEPESATNVFHVNTRTLNNSTISTNFAADMSLQAATSFSGQDRFIEDRLRGFATDPSSTSGNAMLKTNSTSAETSNQYPTVVNVFNNSYEEGNQNSTLAAVTWMWKRAPGYFDVVAYTGQYNASGHNVAHNLGVAPEMMWIKSRDASGNWVVYHKGTASDAETDFLTLNTTNAASDNSSYWNDTAPTSTHFTVHTSAVVNSTGDKYIAYLFATAAGVSKVGSYTGDGTTGRVIDCGFTSGAKFVLIKPTSQTGGWNVYDTARGIVAGNDPVLILNSTAAESTPGDDIDPDNSGFIVNQQALGNFLNGSGVNYIFYAIAT